jgi:fermentation-respiration switch protein FrsA (DUF1100 family)
MILSRRRLARAALVLLGVYALAVTFLLLFEDRLVFHPVPASRRWLPPPAGRTVKDVSLHAADGTALHARWFPRPRARRAVLVCHSRAGNLSLELRPEEVAGWQDVLGASVLIFDYPGYGRSAGAASEVGCYHAADAAYDWLIREQGLASRRLVLYGRSLGSAVAVELASRRPHGALVLVSPPTSLPDTALGQFPLLPARWLMRNRFDSLARIRSCHAPLFVVHGTADRLVSPAQGKELFAAANEPRRFLPVEGARHGDCVRPAFFTALSAFLEAASPLDAPD